MSENTRPTGARRGDRLLREHVHDPYKTRLKLAEPSVCTDCGAEYRNGRWQWPELKTTGAPVRCQACHRIADRYPAGELVIAGNFADRHRAEIHSVARNQEDQEKGQHPLHRIMDIVDGPDGIVVTTTDIHLPRRIGEALHSAYAGDLEFHYDEESYFIRVSWRRDD